MSDAATATAGNTPNTGQQPAQGGDGGTQPQGGAPAQNTAQPAKNAFHGAPESYGDFKTPEGFTLEDAFAADLKKFAKDFDLNQDGAQKVVDLSARVVKDTLSKFEKLHGDQRKQWVEQSKADKEFGGEKLEENLSIAEKALNEWGTPELKELFTNTGVNNHPEVIRFFYRVGKLMGEGGLVQGRRTDAGEAGTFSYDKSDHKK